MWKLATAGPSLNSNLQDKNSDGVLAYYVSGCLKVINRLKALTEYVLFASCMRSPVGCLWERKQSSQSCVSFSLPMPGRSCDVSSLFWLACLFLVLPLGGQGCAADCPDFGVLLFDSRGHGGNLISADTGLPCKILTPSKLWPSPRHPFEWRAFFCLFFDSSFISGNSGFFLI